MGEGGKHPQKRKEQWKIAKGKMRRSLQGKERKQQESLGKG